MLDQYLLLTRLRLRWYIRASGDVLLRHWQWFLIAGLAVPGAPIVALFYLPALLLEVIVSRGHEPLGQLACMLAVQLIALIWIMPQRRLLAGGSFMRYASTLPLSKGVRFGVDLTLLIVANSLMLVPAFIATAHTLTLPGSDRAYQICALWVLLVTALVMQIAALERRAIIFVGVGLADILLGSSLISPSGGLRWFLLTSALAGTIAALLTKAPAKRSRGMSAPALRPMSPVLSLLSRHAPSLLVQCKAVAAHPGMTALRLSMAVVLALAVDRLIAIFRYDTRSLPTAILAMAAISLILSGVYRTLRDAHASMRAYLAALPITPRHWPVRDTFFVMLLGFAPLCILLWALVVHRLSSLFVLFALALAYHALLALLRLPLVFGGRRAVLYGFIMAAAWSGAAMAAVAR